MYEGQLDLSQRLFIITHSSLDDVIILDMNYRNLIRDTQDSETQQQFLTLSSCAQERIKELEIGHTTVN